MSRPRFPMMPVKPTQRRLWVKKADDLRLTVVSNRSISRHAAWHSAPYRYRSDVQGDASRALVANSFAWAPDQLPASDARQREAHSDDVSPRWVYGALGGRSHLA